MNPIMQEQLGRLGHLKNAAAAIVDYVRGVSPESDFQPCDDGWKLKPDTWIHLSLPSRYPPCDDQPTSEVGDVGDVKENLARSHRPLISSGALAKLEPHTFVARQTLAGRHEVHPTRLLPRQQHIQEAARLSRETQRRSPNKRIRVFKL